MRTGPAALGQIRVRGSRGERRCFTRLTPSGQATAGRLLGRYGDGMRDSDVRGALRTRLDAEHELSDTLFVDELGLCGQVRVDVAVVNGSLSGYELKSARDNLRRLPAQVEYYSRVLDFATLVVADCHAEAAQSYLPEWWGMVEARTAHEAVVLRDVRPSLENPNIDPYALAQLLWKPEALEILSVRGMARGLRSKPRVQIWSRLAESLELAELRAEVRTRLKSRRGWRPAL